MSKQNQVWIVRCDNIGHDDGDYESATVFEMAFPDRETAHEVYSTGERTFRDDPSMHWTLTMTPANDVQFALHMIETMAKDRYEEN